MQLTSNNLLYTRFSVNAIDFLLKSFRSGVINEFHRFSKGIDDDGIMDEYYPGKPNKFFADVLALVEVSK